MFSFTENSARALARPGEGGPAATPPRAAREGEDDLMTVGGVPETAAEVAESDEVLIAGLRDHDPAALEQFYDRYHRVAFGLALRMLHDHGAAEDVVQEAFLAVWRQAATFDAGRGNVRTWLHSIVHHRCIDRLRRQAAAALVKLDETIEDAASPEVFHSAYQTLQREQIQRALARLPAEQRVTIELAYFGGLTHTEIAARTGVPLGTVKGRLRIGLQKLRALLSHLSDD